MQFKNTLSTPKKVVLVASGYAVAFAAAVGAVALRVQTAGPDAQASQGMSAFGDAMVFLWVLGFLAAFPTAAAVYFLRPAVGFGPLLSRLAVFAAASGVGAVLVLLAISGRTLGDSALQYWHALAIVRVLPSPLLVGVFALSWFFSREPATRKRLFHAAALETIAALYAAVTWFIPARFN